MGIALDKGFIQSIDDLPEKYVRSLKGTLPWTADLFPLFFAATKLSP
jgi:hypothetical protein